MLPPTHPKAVKLLNRLKDLLSLPGAGNLARAKAITKTIRALAETDPKDLKAKK